MLTLSVRSFQVPATPGTTAWPPSLPSVPTSRDDARDLGGKGAELLDHGVDGFRRAQELPLQRLSLGLQSHGLGEIALRDGADHARHLGRRADQIVDQAVHRFDSRLPRSPGPGKRGSLRQLSLFSDDAADALDLVRRVRHHPDDVVHRIGDFPLDAARSGRQADGEISFLHRQKNLQQCFGMDPVAVDRLRLFACHSTPLITVAKGPHCMLAHRWNISGDHLI
jgi:hypothetical protein